MNYLLTRFTFDQFLETAGMYPQECRGEIDSRAHDCPEWYGASFEEAYRMAVAGWPEGRERIAKSLADIEAVGEDRETMTYDVAGSEPDVGRYLAGEPENMLAFLPTPEKRVIRILACISISCAIDTETVFTRGAAVVALADRLERLGNRVEVMLCDSSKPTHGAFLPHAEASAVTLVQIKAAGQPMDIDRMAFLFGHPASQRRLMFSVKEHVLRIDASHRRPCPIPAEIRETAHIVMPEADSGNHEWKNAKTAAAWIDRELCRFTAPEEVAA